MVEHRLLDLVIETNIETTTLSDHSPVTMKMKVPGAQRRPNLWRLNEELIQYKKDEEIIRKEIEQYFIINDTKEISDSTLWEAHKA